MTNLEFYKDELKECIKNNARELAMVNTNVGNGFSDFSKKYINYYPSDSVAFVDWLLEEHKEPIKLKQWEYDLIGYIYRTSSKKIRFVYHPELNYLRGIGYFKGIINTDRKLSEILDNCEVVE